MATIPAYTYNGITRPALILDSSGHIVLDGAASAFAATYGLRALYIGVPPGTPYPPVTDSVSTPADTNAAANSVVEGAAVNTAVNITVSATSSIGNAVTYSLSADSSGGGFKINPTTGVVSVADPSKIDYETAAGHAYTITVAANDGIVTSSQSFAISVGNVAPSAPVDANAAANSVVEGAAAGALVGITAVSTDVNGPGVTWSLTSDSSGGGFKIDAVTGVVSVADPSKIDYETSGPGHSYTVTARASDGTLTSSQNFTIAVTDAPVSTPIDSNAAANSVAEGAANGSTVGLTAAAADPNGPATVYSLIADSSGGGFTINATTGVVTVADGSKLDFETAAGHAYSVTVQAQAGASTSTQSFVIAVSDVAPSAPVDSNAAANSVVEGAANGTVAGITAAATDINGGAVTYSLVGDTSGGGFTINATTGVITVADASKIDYETAPGHAYSVTAQASDGTLTNSQTFTIAVMDVAPSTPVDANAAANAVAEGAANGSTVGITASSTDVNGPGVTYSLVADSSGGGFTINATTGVVTVADASKIDYETAPGHAYSVTAQASDGTLTSSQVFTIGVLDAAPSTPVDSNAAANTIAEGAANGSTVGITASSTDVNGPAVTYSLTGDTSGGGFTINAATGVITVADSTKIDYESSGGSYTVVAQASDGTLANSQAFTIMVTDVAPATPVDSDAAVNTITEGAANGSAVGITASSTDVNGPAVTYSLIGDTSGGGFTINAATGVITVADGSKIDYETAPGHAYSVTAQASDGTMTSSKVFTIAVTDVAPSAPVDSDAAINAVLEGAANGSTVGITAASTDVNGPAVTYSLVADSSGGGFTINAATGVVTVADGSKIDYETAPGHAYSVTAQASDGTMTSSQVFTISVVDFAPSTPVDSDAAANTIAEGAANGSTVGVTASSTDVNGPAVTYSLTGDTSGGGFTINAATGVVTVADATKIDYETSGGSYTVVAQASDGTMTRSQAFVIAVSDVAPSTPVDSNAAANQTAAGAAVGATVGITASSTDVNGPAVTYSLIGDTSGGGFTINAATGVVTVADTSKIVYNAGDPTFAITVDASDGTLHNQQSFTIDVVLDVPPTITSGHTLAYTENQAATAIDPAISVTDPDTPNLTHATVQITGNYVSGQDVLGFANTANITGSFNAATGTLTLVGSDTVADYQAALAAVTYVNTSEAPSGAPRTITFIANDGILDGAPATATVNVTPVNDAPVAVAGHTLNYTENQAATVFDAAITVSDVDSANLTGATVQITGNYANGQDVLGFVSQNGITGSFDTATGTLTLSGSASVANYQAALDSITYVNSSDNPSGLARTVTIIATDGITPSIPVTGTINVTPVNDAPTTSAGGTLNYTENQAATAIDTSITVNDVDNASLSSATVQIAGNYVSGEDILSFVNQNGITGSFNSATGTLNLTGSSSVANYQSALRSVTYFNNSDNPSGLDRTVSITTNDGALDSNTSTSTIHVTPVNDAPVVTAAGILGYTENQGAVAIAPSLTVTDADTTTLTTASVQISGNYVNGEDLLAFTNTANITGSFDAATGTLTLTGTDTIANYQSALRSVTYADTSDNPSTSARTVTFTADDGQGVNHLSAGSTHTINVTAVDDAPVNSGVPASFVVESGFSHAITGLSIADIDAGGANDITTTLTSAAGSVTIAAVAGGAAITGNGSGAVTLTGTIAEINTSLAGNVAYTAADNAGNTTTTLSIATNDHGHSGTGGPLIDTDIVQIGVLPQVWFINGDQSSLDASAPRGSQANPFGDIAEFNTASAGANGPGVNDYIYLKAGTYTGPGIDLKDGQTLLGDDQPLSFANPLGGAPIVIETASGARPVIHVTTGQAIDLGANNTIAGVNIQTDAGTTGLDDGQGAAGNAVGTLNVSHMAISGAGQAVDIDQGGTLNVVLDSVSSTGGAQGIQLAGTAGSGAGLLSGTFIGGSGAISGATTAGILIGDGFGTAGSGGTATFTYGGTISAAGTARTVDIQDHSTGLVTLSGNLTHTGSGGSAVFLDDNAASFTFSGTTNNLATGTANAISITDQSGGTVSFSGTLNIDTTSGTGINLGGTSTGTFNFIGANLTIDTTGGAGFSATGGGTVNVIGIGNHINSGSGTALNISNTTIGASNVTFQDISSNGAPNGIVLNTTGTSGHLAVTGNGSAGSGGTITASTGDGVNLTNTQDVNLAWMNITNNRGDGIGGSNINGLVLNHLTITGNGDDAATDESGINVTQLTGSASNGAHPTSISNSTITNNNEFEIQVSNSSGTLTNLQLINNTIAANGLAINGNASSPHGNLVNFLGLGTSVMGLTVGDGSANSGGTFTGNIIGDATHNITGTGIFANSGGTSMTVNVSNATFTNNNAGVDVSTDPVATSLTFNIQNNTFIGQRSTAINHFDNGNPPFNRTVNGTIQGNIIGNDAVANSGSLVGAGISISNEGAVNSKYLINNNTIQQIATAPGIVVNVGLAGQATGGGETDLTITNNTIRDINGSRGITIQDNQVTDIGSPPGAGPFPTIFADIHGNTFANIAGQAGNGQFMRIKESFGNVKITQAAATGSAIGTELDDANGINDPTKFSISGGVSFGQGIPPLPTTNPLPLFAASGGVQASSPTPGETHLTQAQLESVVDAAIAQWAAAGASASQIAALRATTFSVADLSGATVGEESAPAHITIDIDAAGHGWFVDPTPHDSFEFTHLLNAAGTDLLADPSSAAAGHLDLLSTVAHEMGHVLGLPDTTAASTAHDLMYINLVDGERRLPGAADVAQARALQPETPAAAPPAQAPPVHVMAAGDTFTFAGLFTLPLQPAAGNGPAAGASQPGNAAAPAHDLADIAHFFGFWSQPLEAFLRQHLDHGMWT